MEEPIWVERILEVFLQSVEWTSLKTPINQTFTYKCQNIDGVWEITMSPWLHEIYGGKCDGAIRLPHYEMNLITLTNEFDKVDYIGFDTDRMQVTIEGKIEDSWVSLILRRSPPRSKTRKKINTFTGEITKIFTNRG